MGKGSLELVRIRVKVRDEKADRADDPDNEDPEEVELSKLGAWNQGWGEG